MTPLRFEGATLHVRLSKEAGVARTLVGDRGRCSCMLQHNAWGDARVISLTIYLGGEGVDADALALPAVLGRWISGRGIRGTGSPSRP